MDKSFASDLIEGMKSQLKFIPSKYFYDETGSQIFRQIMDLPEYYLTNSEQEILENNKNSILEKFIKETDHFNLIEFGAGDGYKTKILINHFLNKNIDFHYLPIDISSDILKHLTAEFKNEFPKLKIEGINDDYFLALHKLREKDKNTRNIVMFLGSNIGNFDTPDAIHFLTTLRKEMSAGDLFFIGFDLKKDPRVIYNAYNDKKGVTAEFNINLLKRINREFDGNFNYDNFTHYPTYDPVTGRAKSFIVSLKEQNVYLKKLKINIEFKKAEPIYTEISQKYDFQIINNFAKNTGFNQIAHYTDKNDYFTDVIWEAV